jgi:POT family proton-dependent oligopeptide transporter
MEAARQPAQGQTWLGHPRGLATLFFTEMWERFSYYGMRGILILFMTAAASTGGLAFSAEKAGAIYGLYTMCVYAVALPGGWIADRILGQRRAIFTGGVIIALGNFTLAIPGLLTFYLGLCLIVIGTGLLKPNVSAIVGGLYPEGGARRDAGFSIFYMGINTGAFVAPLICGWLGEKVNWHYGFLAAGIGMVLGLVQYKLGYKHLLDIGLPPQQSPEKAAQARRGLFTGVVIIAAVVAVLVLLRHTIQVATLARWMGFGLVGLVVLYFMYVLALGKLEAQEKKRVGVIFFLFIGAILFWSGFEQAATSMNLFAERLTNRVVLGNEAPASWLQSVNPLFIISLAPVFAIIWVKLAKANREPSIPVKFGTGLALLGAGFLVMAYGSRFVNVDGPGVTPMWLITTYFLHTLGELCLSPVGLSSITKLSPRPLVGQMMGVWFMGSALGNLFAGLMGGEFEPTPELLTGLFTKVAVVVLVVGGLFLVFSKPIRNMIGGRL